jgi:hypothetical protein
METITLAGPSGLSLTLPHHYAELPEHETPHLPLAAAVEPWTNPRSFRPNITVQVDEPTPALATIEQLSLKTVRDQLSVGVHVAAVDVWPVAGQADGRRVECIYPGLDATILQLQYLTIRAGRCVTLSLQIDASKYDAALELFRYVTGTLAWDTPAIDVAPAIEAVPAADIFAMGRGIDLEFLGAVAAAQPFIPSRSRLTVEDVAELRDGMKRSRRSNERLIAAELADAGGRLTPAGVLAHDLLRKARGGLVAEVLVAGHEAPSVLTVQTNGADAVVVADAPPGESLPDQTLDIIPARTLPIALARWLGLAPAWTFGVAEPADQRARFDRGLWDARMADPAAPAPAGAAPGLLRMWEQPWRFVTIRSNRVMANGPGFLQLLSTPQAGSALVFIDPDGADVELQALPSAHLLHALLKLSGVLSPS